MTDTADRALPIGERAALQDKPWQHWAAVVVNDLAATHPDLPAKLAHIDYVDVFKRGYAVVDLDHTQMTATYRTVESALVPVSPISTPLRVTSWALCRVAISTVEPLTNTGSITP